MNKEKEIKLVWITKYWETKGLYSQESEITEYGFAYPVNQRGFVSPASKNQWFEKREDAVKAIEKMREKKIKSLKQKIAKLENMKF